MPKNYDTVTHYIDSDQGQAHIFVIPGKTRKLGAAMQNNQTLKHLSPRQRECLAMVASHISPKQVARELGISERTVRGYLAESISLLEASDLRDASRIFLESSKADPSFLRGQNKRVAKRSPIPAEVGFNEKIVPTHPSSDLTPPSPNGHHVEFHFRRGKRKDNDLTTAQRLIWIAIFSIFFSILLLTSIYSLITINNFYQQFSHLHLR